MFQKLTKSDLERYRGMYSYPEYAEFITALKPGEGGIVDVAAAKVGRQTVKNRLKASSAALGVPIRFVRSKPEVVVFEVKAK